MISAVTFDLWETLIHEDPEAEVSRRDHRLREIGRILQDNGISIPRESLERAHQEVLQRMDPYWGANLDVSVVEQTRMFLEIAAGSSLDTRLPAVALLEASRCYSEAALKFPPRPAVGAKAVLTAIRASGLKLGLLCNTGRTPGKVLRDVLQRLELKTYFDALIFSDEARLRKPAPELFSRALARLGVTPDAAVHVGDQAETDLAGARAAGLWTVYLRHDKSPEAPASMADYTIRSIDQLPEVLGKLVGVPTQAKPDTTTQGLAGGDTTDLGRDTTHM